MRHGLLLPEHRPLLPCYRRLPYHAAFVTSGSNQRATGTANVDVTVAVGNGDIIVVLAAEDVTAPEFIFSTAAGSTGAWTSPAALTVTNAGDFYSQQGAYALATAAGNVTVRVASSISAWLASGVMVFSGSSFDVASYTRDTTEPWTTSITPGAFIAMSAGYAVNWGSAATPTADTGWTSAGAWALLTGTSIGLMLYRSFSSGAASAQATGGVQPYHVSQFVLTEAAGPGTFPPVPEQALLRDRLNTLLRM